MLLCGPAALAPAPSEPEIVVEGQRLGAGLVGTTLILERRRAAQFSYKFEGDGTYRAYVNGRLHDRGRWRVEGELLCFDATRPGESSCASGVVDKRPGDEWDTLGVGGTRFRARLIAGS
jgi:hypothetical protein